MILCLIGFFTGILSGMGVGGGILLVPLLVILFNTLSKLPKALFSLHF